MTIVYKREEFEAGSDSCFFIGSKVNEAIKILRDKGFMFEYVK